MLRQLAAASLASALLGLICLASAAGSSPESFTAQTDDSAGRIAELERDLAAARRRIAELEAELARVTAPPQTARDPALPEGEELPPESALLSPAHFVRFIREAYARDVTPTLPEDLSIALSQPTLRSIERWVTAKNREWRKPVKWTTRIREINRTSAGGTIMLAVIDPATGEPVGEPIPIRLDDRQLRRIDQANLRNPAPEEWILSALFAPAITVQPSRLRTGLFDSPPFIGPAVELRFQVNMESLVPKPPEQSVTEPTR